MKPTAIASSVSMALVLFAASCSGPHATSQSAGRSLRSALIFHASFDNGANADFGRGDRRLYTATSFNARSNAVPGLIADNVTMIAPGKGRFGDALQFTQKQAPLVFYKAAGNVPYRSGAWSGSVSFWLQADPEGGLPVGFCDPIQITSKAWNDAAFFVEFEKRQETVFRLGVYADYKTWNPGNRKWEEIPMAEKPLLPAPGLPFKPGRWTHVVFTFENLNTGRPDGVARLYIDGLAIGEISARTQTFSWDLTATAIQLGVGYVGMMDDLSLFNQALTQEEVGILFKLPNGAGALH